MAETVAAALGRARQAFANAGIGTAALDARLLLQAATRLDHAHVIADGEKVLAPADAGVFERYCRARLAGEPVSRLLGQREFYGRTFSVSPHVLDPRPDTETIIDLCLKHFPANRRFSLADMGCGSGAIAVTLLAERPLAAGTAVDLSATALETARLNAGMNGVSSRLTLKQSDWFEGLDSEGGYGVFDLIVSNPPYIRTADIAALDREVREHDPVLALDGGADGLACYRAIARQSGRYLGADGMVVVEAGQGQADDIKYIFTAEGFRLADEALDLAGIPRAQAFVRDSLFMNSAQENHWNR